MKNARIVPMFLIRICIANAKLPMVGDKSKIIVFDTPAIKWNFSPSDMCYFEAYRLDNCLFEDIEISCVECILDGQSTMNPSCAEMDNYTISECAAIDCYSGGYSCSDVAMDLFNCVLDEDCYNLPTISKKGDNIAFDTPVIKWSFTPSDVCYFEAYQLDGCLFEDIDDSCVECILSGQSDVMNPSCAEMDNDTISECAAVDCYDGGYSCSDVAMDFFNCVFDYSCANDASFQELTDNPMRYRRLALRPTRLRSSRHPHGRT
ncbi:hypothetical protein ACHAW6_010429 [Cyclotella cf. meneghiniana]